MFTDVLMFHVMLYMFLFTLMLTVSSVQPITTRLYTYKSKPLRLLRSAAEKKDPPMEDSK